MENRYSLACLLTLAAADCIVQKTKTMRKTLLLTSLFLLFNSAFSQIEKGAIQAGGSVRINYEDNQNSRENSGFGFFPRAAYFINDQLSLGARFSVEYARATNGTSVEKGRWFGYGIYARLHKPASEKLFFFMQSSASLQSGTSEREDPAQKFSSNRLNISITPGLTYFMTQKLGMELTFGSIYYRRSEDDYSGPSTRNAVGFDLGLNSISLGASWYF
ncbi:MAG: hypothetical protein Roseis2KO_47320 [Roseivirga sp.]